MPESLTYPGVYIEEISSGVRTITGVATSITAFIGRTVRGPSNKAVTINSFGDFERIFGGLWKRSKLGFAVRDFYLNGGSQAIIVRLFNNQTEEMEAALDMYAAANDAIAEAGLAAAAVVEAAETACKNNNATSESVYVAALKEANDEKNKNEPRKSAADLVAKAAEKAKSGGRKEDVVEAAIEAAKGIATAKTVADAASNELKNDKNETEPRKSAAELVDAAVKEAAEGDGAKAQQVLDAISSVVAELTPETRSVLDSNGLILEAANEGSWGNDLRARIDHNVKGEDAANLFNLSIRDGGTGQVEIFRNVSIAPGHLRRVDKVLENESNLVRVKEKLPDARPDEHAKPATGQDPWSDNPTATCSKVDVKAWDGMDELEEDDFTGPGKQEAKQGLYALQDIDLFNLLCIPPYNNENNASTDLINSAIAYCQDHRAMLLIDSPASWASMESAKNGIKTEAGMISKNAALFFPRLVQPNPLSDNQMEEFVPCGAVAGIFARTDTQRGVWKAPAGTEATLVGVPQLSVQLTDAENGLLNQLGINCLRNMPAVGNVVWGSRTREGDDRLASEWKYIPVRRTALFIEESLYRGTQWVVFEPNDEPLWAQIRLNIGAFMHNLFRQGAFQGTTPKEAYFVKCDKETTTQNDINLG
ncbi:MAG: phage tail sheath subtilisin-like domain-containing protein, partial [Methanothrix sp.]|nr:phage tail sheath subtilisin-like domain-containing protein [Methanothrix sp.]